MSEALATADQPAPPPIVQVEGLWKRFVRQGRPGDDDPIPAGSNAANGDAAGDDVPENGDDDRVTTILRGVDLTIQPGEFAALQGASGSGKSTLLHILGLLDRPSQGRHLLLGQDVSRLSDDALSALRSRHVGFVFQSFYLVPYATALDNVMLPGLYTRASHRDLLHRATELLEMVGLKDRMRHKPNQLSGGQQQRVALARALVNRPVLLLADEPTGQLDSKTTREILDLFARVNEQGATVLLVTHDADVAAITRRRLRMEDGRIVADERA